MNWKQLLDDGMRLVLIALIVLISGCSTFEQAFRPGMAPQGEHELKHPEWAENESVTRSAYTFETRVMESQPMDTLGAFLSRRGIGYQAVSGEHTMITLNTHILFNTGSDKLSYAAQQWLTDIGQYLSKQKNIEIVLNGHTDNTGGERLNDSLSQNRAVSVKKLLQRSGIPSGHIYTRGYGEFMPACTNNTVEGRRCNRRVEITLIVSGHLG